MLPGNDWKTIGIMDSGVGGLSVLRHIRNDLPAENLLYFADQEHVPYGPRPAKEIHLFSRAITSFLLDQDAKIIVVACNTASASSLSYLRETFPNLPFIGMEPAVKPGAEQSTKGKIGILATDGTFGSRRYARLMARYAQGVVVYEDPCLGLVEKIEAGELEGQETERILWSALEPMLDAGVDTVILGCTHYPFVLPLIQRLAGPEINIIDPAPAVSRQVKRVLQEQSILAESIEAGQLHLYTTGDPNGLELLTARLLGTPLPATQAYWQGETVTLGGR